jgi:hypothetical protein
MSNRQDLEAALSSTADRLNPGTGAKAVEHHKNDINMLVSSADRLIKRFVGSEVRLVVPVVVEAKQTDGDPVTIAKAKDGLIAIFAEGVVIIRGVAFGARESKPYDVADLTAESITTVLDGAQVPGVRVVGRHGKPKLALAVVHEDAAADQSAVRDEIVQLLTS